MFGPFASAVLDAQDMYDVMRDAIRNNVRGIGNDEFSRTVDSPTPARIWERAESERGGDDETYLSQRGAWIIDRNVFFNFVQAGRSMLGPANDHLDNLSGWLRVPFPLTNASLNLFLVDQQTGIGLL